MKRTLLVALPIVAVIALTLVAYWLVDGTPRPPASARSTAWDSRPIDTPTRDPQAKSQARLAHALAPIPQDGLRFVAQSASSDREYAFQIAVHAPGAPAKAILIVAPKGGGLKRRYRFNVPRGEETAFFRVIDAVLPRLERDEGPAGAGTAAALERIAAGKSRTWTTALADPAWQPVSVAIGTILDHHVPPDILPSAAYWR
jgi:hypothetical protein